MKPTKHCNDIQQLISDGLDRTLRADEAEAVRAHTAGCAECARFASSMRSGLAGIATLPHVAGNSAVRDSVMTYVHTDGAYGKPRGLRAWLGQGAKLAGAALAFALVGFVLVAVLGSNGGGGDSSNIRGSGSGSGSFGASPSPTEEATPQAVPDDDDTSVSSGWGWAPAPQPCAVGQVGIESAVVEHPGDPSANSPGMVEIDVTAIKITGGAECWLTTDVTVTIRNAVDQPLDIQGNGVTAPLDALIPSKDAVVMFAWMNWCGEPGPYTLDIAVAGERWSEPIDVTPPCDMDLDHSTIAQMQMAEAWPGLPDSEIGCSNILQFDPVEEKEENVNSTPAAAPDSVTIWYIARDGEGCDMTDELRVTLADSDYNPLDVEGNPLTITLRPGEGDLAGLKVGGITWTNWCEQADPSELAIDFERSGPSSGSGSGGSFTTVPACEDASQPSRMTEAEGQPEAPSFPDEVPTQAPESELPACEPSALELLLNVRRGRESDEVLIDVALGPQTEQCHLTANLTVIVTDESGTKLDIENNGISMTVEGDLPVLTDGATFAWSNWCGADGPFTITATFDEWESIATADSGPRCNDEAQPSMLQRVMSPFGDVGPVNEPAPVEPVATTTP